jgi:high-affinity iron transporter
MGSSRSWNFNVRWLLLSLAALSVLGVVVWQAVVTYGVPDPEAANLSPAAVVLSSGVLVFREGLEAILVLAAVTAGVVRSRQGYGRAIAFGAGLAVLATAATWFIVVAIIASIDAPALDVQAATGLLAIVVLLVIMNWFFHKVYWAGWIAHHHKRRRRLLEDADKAGSRTFWGLAFLGFTVIYREGFEIVLFLQNLRLKAGTEIVLTGAAVGLGLTAMVGLLTFAAHRHLPYKKMLIFTGVLLAGVLIVMVGEQVQEMQQAGWIASTPVAVPLPGWWGIWFAIFPNVQGLVAQALAALLVFGSYFSARYLRVWRPVREAKLAREKVLHA